MDNIVLNNGTSLEFQKSDGLNITIENKTFDELETALIPANLTAVQIVNSIGVAYGNYTNLQGISITKMLTDGSIVIKLEEIITAS